VQHFEKIYVFKSDIKKSVVATTFLRHDETRHRIVEDKHGKKSITEFIVMKHKKIAILHTGHKHQIRATLSILGFPIYGDSKYGGKKAYRVFLHASEITLRNLDGTLAYLNNRRFKSQVSF
jgi:23S rRNA pseudouridine955/2504/2580 synthase